MPSTSSTFDPIQIFRVLFEQAVKSCDEPEAVVLSTVDADGQPSGRFVLLKAFDASGFVFYTNLGSRKARALAACPRASLCCYWPPLGKQVRIEGRVEPVSDADADAYFTTRPRASQLGAWASNQSSPMRSRADLEARILDVEARFKGRSVPRPPFWSGLRVVPRTIEFWTRETARLHVRDRYERTADGWSHILLYP